MTELFCGTIETPIVNEDILRTLGTSDLKLFKIKLSSYKNYVSILSETLNSEELLRSKKYHFKEDENRFIICRSFLKIILSKEIGLEASAVSIKKDPLQKPYLPCHPKLFFNVSHSANYALIIIGKRKVGIDLEIIDKTQDFTDTITHIFGNPEKEVLSNTIEKNKTFFTFWTRKESIVKAVGKGIDDDFIKIPATDGFHLLEPKLFLNIPSLVTLSFNLDEKYVGAITFEGNISDISKKYYFTPLPPL